MRHPALHAPARRLLSVLSLVIVAATASADEPVDYTRQIKPLLKHRCYSCHGALQQKSGLRLDTVAGMKRGGDGGPAIEPGKPDDSRLLELVAGVDGPKMPPKGEATPLSADEIALLRRWISQGAEGPKDEQSEIDPHDYWSYKLPQRANVPAVKNADWVRTPIDAFIAAEHERHALQARPAAPREIWLRRVFLDLIGLPPTRDELHRFLADESPGAYDRVVDDLLERPQYGERWGRHWMDVWRYSDWYGSRGINEIRYSQRHIWRWRDWIVESLNADKPYDRMIVEMLAGDEVAPTDPNTLRATGFIGRNWYKFDRNVWMFDAVEHTAQAFLGLTLRCARCHDHKYDPIAQEDYYRFRAFFEPHDVRTDRLAGDTPTEKDATLGMVLKDGVARVFDKQADAVTYVFQRGDNRYPDKDRPMQPGVPAALGNNRIEPQVVALPPEAYYPALQPVVLEGLVAQAQAGIAKAQQELDKAKASAEAARKKREELAARIGNVGDPARPGSAELPPVFHDDFSKPRSDVWKAHSGEWVYENGRLVQKAVANFATFVSSVAPPRDFQARWKYRPLEAGTLRSIGFSFDYVDQANSQDIYTHVNDQSQGIQAFHRQNGQQVYPQAAIVKTTSLKVGATATVEVEVRGVQLTLRLNGEKVLDYVLPIPRRDGKFAIWAHQGAVEFEELTIRELVPTPADLERQQQTALELVALAEKKLISARAEVESILARAAAEKARYANSPAEVAKPLALSAGRAERAVALAKAEEALVQAEQAVARTRAVEPAASTAAAAPSKALADAEKKLADAQKAFAAAKTALENPDENYAPLGDQFPTTSTGRRLALAQWIANPLNPRTARVAVNHIWLRHFGQALVPSVDNFGLNGQSPSHPELLDWLAVELMENGWRMKPIHRLIVLSNTYRLSSTVGNEADANHTRDPDNRFLWHGRSRRMEAEVVRDSVLAAAGTLDLKPGGPEIPEAEGQAVPRRSIYFRNTPNEKMKFLETFDVADPNQCYRRRESVVPQQALALMNSALALDQSRLLAAALTKEFGEPGTGTSDRAFITAAYEQLLTRAPTAEEIAACLRFLERNAEIVQSAEKASFPAGGQSKQTPAADRRQRARENLIHVLYSHNDFVTIR